MRVGIKITLADGSTIVYSVHELLEAAQDVMRTKYSRIRRQLSGPRAGSHFHPTRLTSPDDWLAASKLLKQGKTKSEKETIDMNLLNVKSETWLYLIEYYSKKINIDDLNNQGRKETTPVWEFAEKNITECASQLKDNYVISKNIMNYRVEDLGEVKEKPTTNLPSNKKKKSQQRQRGIYLYKIEGSNDTRCLIVHSKDNSKDIAIKNTKHVKKLKRLDNKQDIDRIIWNKVRGYLLEADNGITFYLTYVDLALHLQEINGYLSELQWSLTTPEKNEFLDLFLNVYQERCRQNAPNL